MIKYGIKKVFTVDSRHLADKTLFDIREYIAAADKVYDESFSKLSMHCMGDDIIVQMPADMFDPNKSIDEELEYYSGMYDDLFALMKSASQNDCDWLCICD